MGTLFSQLNNRKVLTLIKNHTVHFANALRSLKELPNFHKCTKVTTISSRDIEELQEWHDNMHNEVACGRLAVDMSIETQRLNKRISNPKYHQKLYVIDL
jgi:hypothetical protein